MSDLSPDAAPAVDVAPDVPTSVPADTPADVAVPDSTVDAVPADVPAEIGEVEGTDESPEAEAAAASWLAQQPADVQKVVGDARKDAASYREKYRPFRDAFDGYDDGDRDIWLTAAKTFRDDPQAVAQWMRDQADAILGGDTSTDTPAPSGDEDGDLDRPLTRREYQEMIDRERQAEADAKAQQDRAAAEEQAINDIKAEAKTLGYDGDSTDVAAQRAYRYLLQVAHTEFKGDLKAAHEALQAERQSYVADFVAQRGADVDGAAQLPPQAGGPARAENADTETDPWKRTRMQSMARRTAAPIR